MINLNQWLYSRDIAKWLTNQKPLSVTEQIDCICSNKSSLRIISSGRKPKETIDQDKLRMQYVKELAIKVKQNRAGC